jgi:hypothetical protein
VQPGFFRQLFLGHPGPYAIQTDGSSKCFTML